MNRVLSSVPGHNFGDCNYGNNIGTSLSFNGGQIDGPTYVIGPYPNGGINYGSANGASLRLLRSSMGLEHAPCNSEWVKGRGTAGDGLWQVYSIGTNLTDHVACPSGAGMGWQAILSAIGTTWPDEYYPELEYQGYFLERRRMWYWRVLSSHLQPPNKKACVFNNQKEARILPRSSGRSGRWSARAHTTPEVSTSGCSTARSGSSKIA